MSSGEAGIRSKKILLLFLWSLTANFMLFSQTTEVPFRIDPPNWWVGLKNPGLQIMIHGEAAGTYTPSLDQEGVRLVNWVSGDSPNYLFLDLEISAEVKPGTLQIALEHREKEKKILQYELRERSKPSDSFGGFDASDAVYLITPDRFANGNPDKDVVEGMKEQIVDRKDDYARHGGDLRGIIQHLDYIHEMGFTAIWSSPLLVNDMPQASYHGYAITDFYRVDPRFGTLEDYKELASKAAGLGIKLIMDQVVNHCGIAHWWMEDLPFSDWIHFQKDYLAGKAFKVTNHRRTVNQDLYAAKTDRTLMNRGWFVPSMPDLNPSNPHMATYLIQHSIWWIETLGLGGIRQDTYSYPDKNFMAKWARSIMEEYPRFSIVGEEWSYNPLLVAYWQEGAANKDGYRSHLKSTMDFPLQRALIRALRSEERWDSGLIILYEALANDFHYPSPRDLLLFADNHDMDRLYTQLDEDPELAEMALAFVLTAPRIPQIYYGTEVLLQNSAKPGDHGLIRTDFPGGWEGDKKNAFVGEGLSPSEIEMQGKLRKLLNFRKGNQAIHHGETIHFAPENGIYVMARSNEKETVVLVLNKNENPIQIALDRYAELQLEGRFLTEIFRGSSIQWNEKLSLSQKGAYVYVTSP